MRYLIFFVVVAIISSCNQNFTSPEQAENKLNDSGLRVGKWVDYIQQDGSITLKNNEYEYYLLSQYKKGRPIKNFIEVNADSTLRRTGTFRSTEKVYYKDSYPREYVDSLYIYFTTPRGKTVKSYLEIYNESGDLVKGIKYFYSNPKGNLVDTVVMNYSYYPDSIKTLKSKSISLDSREIEFNFDFLQTNNVDYDIEFYKFYREAQNEYAKKAIPEGQIGSPMAYLITSAYSILGDSISIVRLEKYKLFEGENNHRNIIEDHYKVWKNTQQVSKANMVTCSYCGRVYDRRKGYIQGFTIAHADDYNNFMLKIELEKKYYGTSAMQFAYKHAKYFCSEQCVTLSGLEIIIWLDLK